MSNQANSGSRNAEKFVVRLPQGMRVRISAAAKLSHRSMNSEFIWRLEHSLSVMPPGSSQSEVKEPKPIDDPLLKPTHTFEIKTVEGDKQIPLYQLDNREVRLLKQFRNLSQEKQQALAEFASAYEDA